MNEHYDAYVQFLADQMRLDDLMGVTEPTIHAPVVKTRAGNIWIGAGSRIDSFVKLEGGEGLEIGRYVHIASFAHVGIGGGWTAIHDYAAIASGARVISGSNLPEALTMSACAPEHMQCVVKKRTVIDRYAVVLCNAVVLPGVTLHEGAILAAGGVATHDIPAWEIWAGTPARFLRTRTVKS